MKQDDLPPQLREPKHPEPQLFEELPAAPPDAAVDPPTPPEPPPRAPEPFLRRG